MYKNGTTAIRGFRFSSVNELREQRVLMGAKFVDSKASLGRHMGGVNAVMGFRVIF